MNWLRVTAAVLASKLFFLASCTTGMFASAVLKDKDDYGPAIVEGGKVPQLATVVATVPDADKPGQRKVVFVFVSAMDEFRKKNPDYSFLLPPGNGRIEDTGAEMVTSYSVIPAGPGKIIVKNDFHHDVPPAGMDIKTRYEATDKSFDLLNVKYESAVGRALVVGLVLASVLLAAGKIINWRIGPDPSAIPPPAEKPKAGWRKFVKIAILIYLGLSVIVVIVGLLLKSTG